MSFAFRIAHVVAVLALMWPASARAQDDKPSTSVIVVATDGASDAAWPLAAAVYRDARLRPQDITDARARVLAGESAPESDVELRELGELRAAVKGDDEASRQVLSALATRMRVAIVVVVFSVSQPTARVFNASSKHFGAARYVPDAHAQASALTWMDAVTSIRTFLGIDAAMTSLESPPKTTSAQPQSRQFYQSPWFWVAVGVAVLAGGGVLIATNIQTSDAVHLQARMP